LLACVLAAPQPEPLAQHGEEALVLPRLSFALGSVDPKLQPHAIDQTRARARAPMTASTWRRYAAVPRTSSIGLDAAATRRPNSFSSASLGPRRRSQPCASRR